MLQLSNLLYFQAGAWPIGQSNLPTFAIPQELEKSVSMVGRLIAIMILSIWGDKCGQTV